MVQTKRNLFEEQAQELADIYKALSHPARVTIMQFLSAREECYSGDITEELPLGRTTINQHLAELKKVGLIKGTVEGKRVCYCIDMAVAEKYEELSKAFFQSISLSKEGKCCNS